jgi:Na+/proline symporter
LGSGRGLGIEADQASPGVLLVFAQGNGPLITKQILQIIQDVLTKSKKRKNVARTGCLVWFGLVVWFVCCCGLVDVWVSLSSTVQVAIP